MQTAMPDPFFKRMPGGEPEVSAGDTIRRSVLRPAMAAALFVLCAFPAHATSCTDRNDRYVFACDGQRCVGEFRVEEVWDFRTCGRRPVVKAIDPQVAEFLASLVASPSPGVYTITIPVRYWHPDPDDDSLGALLDRMNTGLNDRPARDEDRERVDLRSLSPVEQKKVIERRLGEEWLSKDTEHQSALEARRAWERKAWRARALAASLWGAFWGSFAAALVWLAHSIHVFFFRLYQAPARGLRRFASPLLAQLIIGAVGVAAVFVMPFEFWPGTLLVPVVIVVLLAEGWAGFRRRHVA